MAGAFRRPTTIGPATAATPAEASRSLLAVFSAFVVRFDMITSMRFLRSEPVTPDAQANGDSRYNSQVLRMLPCSVLQPSRHGERLARLTTLTAGFSRESTSRPWPPLALADGHQQTG